MIQVTHRSCFCSLQRQRNRRTRAWTCVAQRSFSREPCRSSRACRARSRNSDLELWVALNMMVPLLAEVHGRHRHGTNTREETRRLTLSGGNAYPGPWWCEGRFEEGHWLIRPKWWVTCVRSRSEAQEMGAWDVGSWVCPWDPRWEGRQHPWSTDHIWGQQAGLAHRKVTSQEPSDNEQDRSGDRRGSGEWQPQTPRSYRMEM